MVQRKKDFGYWGTSKRYKIDMTSDMRDYKVKDYFLNDKIVKYGTEGCELKTKFVEPLFVGKESKDEKTYDTKRNMKVILPII